MHRLCKTVLLGHPIKIHYLVSWHGSIVISHWMLV